MARRWRKLRDDQRGVELVEVLVVIVVFALGAAAAMSTLADQVDGSAQRVSERVIALIGSEGLPQGGLPTTPPNEHGEPPGSTPPSASTPPPSQDGESSPSGDYDSPSGGSDDDYYGDTDSSPSDPYGDGPSGPSGHHDDDEEPGPAEEPADGEYVVIDGSEDSGGGWIETPQSAREAAFALRHPIAARAIGKVERGSHNISTNAVRFSTSDIGLDEADNQEGSQVNAFRHALWQATIAKRYGNDTAAQAGNAHEENPNALNRVEDPNRTRFTTSALADEAVDLLNNRIARQIGEDADSEDMNDIALDVLDHYHEHGLWVSKQEPDGTWSISQETLSDEQYEAARARLLQLDENGEER